MEFWSPKKCEKHVTACEHGSQGAMAKPKTAKMKIRRNTSFGWGSELGMAHCKWTAGFMATWYVRIYVYIHVSTLHYITLHFTTLHYTTLHYITLHYFTLHYVTLHYITLHCITLHYITLHHIILHVYIYIRFGISSFKLLDDDCKFRVLSKCQCELFEGSSRSVRHPQMGVMHPTYAVTWHDFAEISLISLLQNYQHIISNSKSSATSELLSN